MFQSLLNFFNKKKTIQKPTVSNVIQLPTVNTTPTVKTAGDILAVQDLWSNPNNKISKYFTVKELTYLPKWGIYHIPSKQEKENLTKLALVMDIIRDELGLPVNVHVSIRPTSVNCIDPKWKGQNYNKAVGSIATKSAHIIGLGMDFDCGENCDKTREKILPLLEKLNIRMEKKPGAIWVHVDLMPPNPNRYFPV